MTTSFVDFYASEYGWTRNYILDEIYIDEHFKQLESIDKRQRQNHLMSAYITMLPNMKDKDRKEFLNNLQNGVDDSLIGKNIKTDYDAIERAKRQLQKSK